jgi:hypothetical protein
MRAITLILFTGNRTKRRRQPRAEGVDQAPKVDEADPAYFLTTILLLLQREQLAGLAAKEL